MLISNTIRSKDIRDSLVRVTYLYKVFKLSIYKLKVCLYVA
jgi:hypothetical protein